MKPFQMPSGPIQSPAQLRKIAAALSSSRRDADNETPQVLLDYFDDLKDEANRSRTVEARYRTAWWALKLQDNHEVYFQLEAAKRDAEREGRKPVVEVEQMLLELAVQNERPENIVRHLDTLCKIDPANYEEYRHQWAEAKFNLGSEDIAVRELKKLAAKPGASLQTLGTLTKIYSAQGNTKKQIEVWESAYRKANLFEKRTIVRQLVAALLDQRKPQAALKAQMDLVYRETDLLQRRKQFESQVTVASRNYLLDWLKDRYLEAAQKKPFDRFFPEALGRIHLAMGYHREAFDSMKKAYYMSGENDELLDELGELGSKLGDLNSAIYYSRQIISRGEGGTNIENWEKLIRMLEKDFRFAEADLMRKRLEVKFGQDPDFLERLASFYQKNHRLKDAHRVFRKRANLREWDVRAQFDLALIKLELGDRDAARPLLESIIVKTKDEALPSWSADGLYPLIPGSDDPAHSLEALNFEIQTFPMIPLEVEDALSDWSESRTHPEFTYRPRDHYAIRLRALEELGKCISHMPNVEALVTEQTENGLLPHETWWLAHYSGSNQHIVSFAEKLESGQYLATLATALSQVSVGETNTAEWQEEWEIDIPLLPFASFLAVKNGTNQYTKKLVDYLCETDLFPAIVNHVFTEWRNHNRFQQATKFGEAKSEEHPQLTYLVSQVADWSGDTRKQTSLLDLSLEKYIGLDYGGVIPGIKQVAIADRYRACDTPEEEQELLEQVSFSLNENPLTTKLTLFQAEALFETLAGDYETAFEAMAGFADEILKLRPRPYGNEIRRSRDNFGWERLKKELQFYDDFLPREARESDLFSRAFGGEPFSKTTEDDIFRVYEFYEAYRIVSWLNGLSAVDRSLLIQRALPEFQTLDGRLDFARDLEKFGYSREATDVYHREVINGTEDYAPIRGLFKTANATLSPEPALDVLNKLETGELPAPPGLTAGYINEQYARMLWHSRDITLLAQLSEPPVTREGEPPLKTTSHLAFQDELINAYLYSGEHDQLIELLTDQRSRGESTSRDLLLGSDLLIKNGDFDTALLWLDQISYAQKDTDSELKALDNYFRIYSQQAETNKEELKWLSRVALQYSSIDLSKKLAALFIQREEMEEALSLLKIQRRNATGPTARSDIQRLLLDTIAKHFPDDSERLSTEIGIYLAGISDVAQAGAEITAWASQNRERLTDHIEIFETYQNHQRAAIPASLIAGFLNDTLPDTVAEQKEMRSPTEFETVLLLLSHLGEAGKQLAAAEVSQTLRPGPSFFEGDPATQIRFFTAINDRTRLLETHASLMRMAESYFFFGRATLSGYQTLQRQWEIPNLLNQLGHTDLARSMFTKFYQNIRHFRSHEVPFLENYVDFLISSGEFETAERVISDITKHAIGFDLRKIVQLYQNWGKIDQIPENLTRYELTSGQRALVIEWQQAAKANRPLIAFENR